MGLSLDKLVIIGIIAVVILGPERLPMYAQKLAQLVRSLRGFADQARDRMREEMGPEFDDVDWRKLDPRQYDPRRIIREALFDSAEPDFAPLPAEKPKSASMTGAAAAKALTGRTRATPPPFDDQAT